MTKDLTFTKRVAKSGRGYLIWIPKDVADYAKINDKSYVEIKMRKLEKE